MQASDWSEIDNSGIIIHEGHWLTSNDSPMDNTITCILEEYLHYSPVQVISKQKLCNLVTIKGFYFNRHGMIQLNLLRNEAIGPLLYNIEYYIQETKFAKSFSL